MIGQLTEAQIEEVLKTSVVGRIGCGDGNSIYVVPVSYAYQPPFIIAHSLEGMKIRMMRKNPDVCFEVDDIKSFTNWKSVIAWGKYEEINDEGEKYRAMDLFVKRMMRMKISETANPPEISGERVHPRSPGNIKPVIFRIALSSKTGRFENDTE
jgi:nitroimidazol reductase NimA-like FMN-containing flavoprotein (pyridoxamine 5'-phosphate oxidase superfamily)